jgi:anthranilate synthase/aminodeoxychorismate synthase-like glutamine amidotransferase
MEAALIDNNDSFTYNIVELVRRIPGVDLAVIPYEELRINEFERYEKLIISPGPGLPDEFPRLQEVLEYYHSKIPMLGICLGHEAIARFFGAELAHLPSVVHGQPKEISVQTHSVLFNGIPSKFNAGLYHSWVIDKQSLPDTLQIIAVSEDDNIMSFRHKEYELFGVQFHPESIITEFGKEMMTNFLNPAGDK